MPIRQVTFLALLLWLAPGLAACSFSCPDTELGQASSYGYDGRPIGEEVYNKSRYLPVERWVRNPDVEDFISKVVRSEGSAVLQSKYGLQCVPRSTPDGCPDCSVCTKSLVAQGLKIGVFDSCGAIGIVHIRADVGPGQAVSAQTYWHWPETKTK